VAEEFADQGGEDGAGRLVVGVPAGPQQGVAVGAPVVPAHRRPAAEVPVSVELVRRLLHEPRSAAAVLGAFLNALHAPAPSEAPSTRFVGFRWPGGPRAS